MLEPLELNGATERFLIDSDGFPVDSMGGYLACADDGNLLSEDGICGFCGNSPLVAH